MFGLLATAGCQKVEEVQAYTVAKPPAPVKPRTTPPAVRPAEPRMEPVSGPARILGAIVPHGAQTWFFKLTGPTASVIREVQPFLDFVKSLHFEGETPRWTVPDGWTEKPGNQFRFATLVIDSDASPLELSVSSLPAAEGDFNEYLLANINRWRNQLQAPPLAAEDLDKATVKIDLDKMAIWLVNIEGWLGADGMGRSAPAERPREGAAAPANAPRTGPAELAPLPLKFELPAGWVRKAAGPMRMAEFETRDADRKVVISVSTAGGDLLANITRWRGQIGLDPIDADQLKESLKKIDVLGVSADYVELVGPQSAGGQTILGVIAPVGDRQWFLKLQGDSALAKREQPQFEAFVKSIRLPGPGEGTDGQ